LELFAIEAFFGTQPEDEKIKQMTKVFDIARELSVPVVAIRSEEKLEIRKQPRR
jgi:DhnA family fructose-bisphosphate aldolase class Ia